MSTITYSFTSGYEGWGFEDQTTSATGSASRTYDSVNDCISVRLIDPGPINSDRSIGTNFLFNLAIPFVIGNTVEMDYSAPSDAKACSKQIEVFFSDGTSDATAVVSNAIAGTLTFTSADNKTIERIDCRIRRQCGTSGRCPFDITVCLEEVRITATAAITATPGKLRTPQAVIDEQSDGGGGMPGGDGGGSGGNLASISADGTQIYIASFNDLGYPTLIKIASTLASDGSVVFDPGAGSRIGVICGKQNGGHLWIAGQFDSTNTVEKSENSGSSFAVKDDATFGAIRTFDIMIPNDERIIIFDGDNGAIIESLDSGETWTTHATGLSQLANSIDRFQAYPEEIVIVNQGDVANSVNYSPNSGANLEDYQTGVYPNADGTKVVVNP